MATAIEIRRKSTISWVLIPDGVAANDVQEAWWRGTRFGDTITFKSVNGAVEFKDINYQYISYVDEVTPANSVASFASGYECYNYLKEQGFFDVGSGEGSGATTFRSLTDTFSSFLGRGLQVLRVNAAMTAIESFVLNAASKLSELSDGPGNYQNGKYIRGTATGWVWSDGFNVEQNNIAYVRYYGFVNSIPGINDMVSIMNSNSYIPLNISEIYTPVILYVNYNSIKYPFIFKPGKGTYGSGTTLITSNMLFQLAPVNLTIYDIDNDPNAEINNLDPVTDGDFVAKANTSLWDFSDSEYQTGEKSYYFSYTDDGVLYYALFVGAPGIYGAGGTPFTEDDFITTSSETPPVQSTQKLIRIQAASEQLQSNELIGASILSIGADGMIYYDWENLLPDIVFDSVTGEITGITSFPNSLIGITYIK
jgi:hypothetical protein